MKEELDKKLVKAFPLLRYADRHGVHYRLRAYHFKNQYKKQWVASSIGRVPDF